MTPTKQMMIDYLIEGNSEPEDMAELVLDLFKRLDAHGENNIQSLINEMNEEQE